MQRPGAAQLGGRGRRTQGCSGHPPRSSRDGAGPWVMPLGPGLSRTPSRAWGGCGEAWSVLGPSCRGGGSAPGPMPVSPQLRLWNHSGGGDGGLQVGCRARLLPQHLQGRLVSSPPLPWNAETRPCRRGLGAAPGGAWTLAQLRGGVALGTCCKLRPRAVRGLSPSWGLGPALSWGGGTQRPARIGRPSGLGDGLAWAPPAPCRAAGQGQAGGRPCGPRPVSHEPGDNKRRHLIYMTKCRHYCRLTESRSGQFPKII